MDLNRIPTAWAFFLSALALVVAGCVAPRPADEAVRRALVHPAPGSEPPSTNALADAFTQAADNRAAPATVSMDLDAALRLAAQYSRSLQTRREQLYLGGLAALAARRQFGPQLSGTLGYVLNSAHDLPRSNTARLDLGAGQILGSGATVSAKTQSSATTTNDAGNSTYQTSASLSLRQPLLAGGGYEASHEALIQAEQDLLYALRAFTLDRQDFAIGISKSYYDLLIQKSVLDNTRQTADQSAFLRQRAEAMFKVRRAPMIDVLRAQQQELSASTSLSQTEADFDVGVRRFLITLGMPVQTRVAITGAIPPLKPLQLDADSCLRTGLDRRLDLKTDRDRVEDARRRLRTARRGLLPQVDAYGQADWSGEPASSIGDVDLSESLSAGVVMELPLDRRDERDAVRKARIGAAAAERGEAERSDSLQVQILDGFRRLQSLEAIAGVEASNMTIARRRLDYAVLRFKTGELGNRDVVEAQNELLNSQNAHARALVAYEQQRVQLLRDAGLLDVAADGTLSEQALPKTQ
jgi:outer membrane protein TolC